MSKLTYGNTTLTSDGTTLHSGDILITSNSIPLNMGNGSAEVDWKKVRSFDDFREVLELANIAIYMEDML